MPIRATRPKVEYVNPDPGLYIGVCVDIEGPFMVKGFKPEDPEKEAITIYWLLNKDNPKTGKPFEVQRRFNLSMYAAEKYGNEAALYSAVTSWLGTKLTQKEADEFDLEILLGESAQIQIVLNTMDDGRTFANVSNVLPLASGQARMAIPEGYQRRKDRQS